MINQSMSFNFISSYMGTLNYMVRTPDETYRIEVHVEASEYHRSIFYAADRYDEEVVARVGCITRPHDALRPVPDELVEAMNLFRQTEYQETLKWAARVGIAGCIKPDDPLLQPPVELRGAYWNPDLRTWIQQRPH